MLGKEDIPEIVNELERLRQFVSEYPFRGVEDDGLHD
jgi:hypothetical protein